MRIARRFLVALVSLSCLVGIASRDAAPKPAASNRSAAGLASPDLLPPDLRAAGGAIRSERDETRRAELAGALAEQAPRRAERFLLALLERDASPAVRREIVGELGRHSDATVREALARHAASDADPSVSLAALDRLREEEIGDLRKLLDERVALAARRGEEESALLAEQERWISLARGTMLPAFLRVPPELFAVKPETDAIRVLAFGDYGDGSEAQKSTAAAMRREHARKPFDFGITLGDNFYEEGMASPSDLRWASWWEDLYGPLAIRFYASFGNHDWKLADSPAAEILYSGKSPSWRIPSPYYTFTAGPVQFFALDTNEVSDAQLEWLDRELSRSRSPWKLVYGHHPIYSAGKHGDTKRLVERLLPVLRGRANVYLCGHDHDLQHLKEDGGVHFFVAGAGGAEQRPIHAHPRTIFAKTDVHGFATLEANATELTVRFVSANLDELYEYTLHRRE